MISQQQKQAEIINKIPIEGDLIYQLSRKTFCFSAAYAIQLVDSFFAGKKPPAAEEPKHAEILLGAPGSGKSFSAQAYYNALPKTEKASTLYISYDEGGALFAIHDYQKALKTHIPDFEDEHTPVDEETLGIRTALSESYRPFSQYVRSLILRRALKDGYNVIIDTTSSSRRTLHLVDRLRELEYDRIDVTGTYAPFDISMQRLHQRVRPATNKEAISKCVGNPAENQGAMNMILPLVEAVDGFEYFYNPNNDNLPELAFAYEHGQLVESRPEIIQLMKRDIVRDTFDMYQFLQENDLELPRNYYDPSTGESAYVKATHVNFLSTLNLSDLSKTSALIFPDP